MASVTVVNSIEVPEEFIEQAIDSYDDYKIFFKKQKGFISAKLLKSDDISGKFNLITISEWDSKESYEATFFNRELVNLAAQHPECTRNPASYEIIRGA